MTKVRWTPIDGTSLAGVIASGKTYKLPRDSWPEWAQKAPQFEQLWIYGLAPGETSPSYQTTAEIVVRLLSQRFDPKDREPYNYDWYAVARLSSNSYVLSGPHKNIDFGHHLAQPVSNASLGL